MEHLSRLLSLEGTSTGTPLTRFWLEHYSQHSIERKKFIRYNWWILDIAKLARANLAISPSMLVSEYEEIFDMVNRNYFIANIPIFQITTCYFWDIHWN